MVKQRYTLMTIEDGNLGYGLQQTTNMCVKVVSDHINNKADNSVLINLLLTISNVLR